MSHLFLSNFLLLFCNLPSNLSMTSLIPIIAYVFLFQFFILWNLTDDLDLEKYLVIRLLLNHHQWHYLGILYFYFLVFLVIQFYGHQILDWQYEWHIFCNILVFILQFLQDTLIFDLNDWRSIKLQFLHFDQYVFLQCFYLNWLFYNEKLYNKLLWLYSFYLPPISLKRVNLFENYFLTVALPGIFMWLLSYL